MSLNGSETSIESDSRFFSTLTLQKNERSNIGDEVCLRFTGSEGGQEAGGRAGGRTHISREMAVASDV